MAGRPADIDPAADPVSVALYTGSPTILRVDTDDELGHFSSDSDDQSEIEYGNEVSARGDSMDEQDSEDDNGSSHEMDEEEERASEPRDWPDIESERQPGLAKLCLHTLMNQPIPESNLRTLVEASEDIVEEENQDYESEFGLSDAGAQGIRALFDDSLMDNAGDAYLKGDEESDSPSVNGHEIPAESLMPDDKLDTPKLVTFANFPHFDAFAQVYNEDSLSQTNLKIRQPSPSDAAMVKTAAPSTTLLNNSANPVRVHHMPSQDFERLTAQSLGDKTGKHDFFAAREDNRAKVYGGPNDHHGTSSTLQSTKTGLNSTVEEKRERSLIAMANFREKKRRMEEAAKSELSASSNSLPVTFPTSRAVNSSNLSSLEEHRMMLIPSAIQSFTGLPYLDDHTQTPKAMRPLSPEPDMTSAVAYNESKASMASANKLSSKSSGRSGLSINDIIEGAGDHSSKTQKRKADDISEAIENEIRVWASSSPAPNSLEGLTAISTSALQASIREEQSETVSTALNQNPEQRPAKRLRKFAESVGYVALGGATLFGALVLSAPDFL